MTLLNIIVWTNCQTLETIILFFFQQTVNIVIRSYRVLGPSLICLNYWFARCVRVQDNWFDGWWKICWWWAVWTSWLMCNCKSRMLLMLMSYWWQSVDKGLDSCSSNSPRYKTSIGRLTAGSDSPRQKTSTDRLIVGCGSPRQRILRDRCAAAGDLPKQETLTDSLIAGGDF